MPFVVPHMVLQHRDHVVLCGNNGTIGEGEERIHVSLCGDGAYGVDERVVDPHGCSERGPAVNAEVCCSLTSGSVEMSAPEDIVLATVVDTS